MNAPVNFFNRIGQWFKPGRSNGERLPLEQSSTAIEPANPTPRLAFLRPWAKRDAAIASLKQGFGALTDLMTTIRDNLEQQSRRQDAMLSYLAHLPQIVESLPETQRMQGETLRAMGQQLQQQVQQQGRLTEILAQVGEAGADQKRILQALSGNVEGLSEHNQRISDNLRHVGSVMESMGRSSECGTQVLQKLRDNITERDGQLHELFQRHNRRMNILLIVAISLSALAIVAAGILGFLLIQKSAGM